MLFPDSRSPSGGGARTFAILLVLWGVTVAFNITKGVHIDDRAYLHFARHILGDPLHPMSGRLNLYGIAEPLHQTNQPPLLFYVYALVMRVFGESELALHGVMALWSLAVMAAFHGLARALAARWALVLTAMFCLGPAFLPGQNLMTDVPMTALWLVFFLLLVLAHGGAGGTALSKGSAPETAAPAPVSEPLRGVRASAGPGRWRWFAAAGAVAAAACLIKYVSLVLIPILVLVIVLRRAWRALWTAAIPIAVLAAWSAFNVMEYGTAHLLSRPTTKFFSYSLANSCEEWVIGLGAVCPFSCLAVPFLLKRAHGRRILAGCALAALSWLAWGILRMPEPVWHSALRAAFAGSGALLSIVTVWCLVDGLRSARRNRPADEYYRQTVLALWVAGAAGFVIVLAPFMAVRHLLPVVPAILLIVGGQVFSRVGRAWRAAAAVATVALGVLLAASDWHFADLYRQEAPAIAKRHAGPGTTWFVGHWGWQWYAEKAGMKAYVRSESVLKPGDVLVVPTLVPRYWIMAEEPARLEKIDEIVVAATPATLLRTMSVWPRWSGYYAYHSGGLPWMVSRAPVEKFVVYLVREPDAGAGSEDRIHH